MHLQIVHSLSQSVMESVFIALLVFFFFLIQSKNSQKSGAPNAEFTSRTNTINGQI